MATGLGEFFACSDVIMVIDCIIVNPSAPMSGTFPTAMQWMPQLEAARSATDAKAPARGRGGGNNQRLAGALERVAELESENRDLREQAARRAQVYSDSPLAVCYVLVGIAQH